MKKRSTLLLWVCLFSNTLLSAQVKQGFKFLEQAEFEKAHAAFQKDLADPEKSIAAGYGILRSAAGLGREKIWLEALKSYEKTLQGYNSAEEATLKKLQKEYQITKIALEQAYDDLFGKVLTFIEATPNTEALRDSFLDEVTSVPKAHKVRFNKLMIHQKEAPRIKRERMDPASYVSNKPVYVERNPPAGSRLEFVKGVNTTGSEYIPVLSADGRTMFFVGSGRVDNYSGEDVFFTERLPDGTWAEPKIEAFFSGPINEAVVSMSADGNHLILFIGGKPHLSSKTMTGWSEPRPILLPKAYAWIGIASITRNGEALIFESKETVRSDIDICIALRRKNGDWELPFNLGKPVNTPADDRTPFLHSDFKTLYFSSAGHGGQGSFDIFKTTRLDDTWKNWSPPENLGPGVNTASDEFGFCVPSAGNVAYLATRTTGAPDQDIMRIPLDAASRPEAQVIITGVVADGKGQAVQGRIIVEDAETQKVLQEVTPRPDGSYSFSVPKTARISYYVKGDSLVATKKTVINAAAYQSEVAEEKVDFVTVAEVVREGKALELRDLLFDLNESELRPESKTALQRIFQEIQAFNWTIEIGGHTDNTGTEKHNLKLSSQRAQKVRDYLVRQGYPAEKISAKGYGASVPIAGNDSEAGRALNRRVEIKIKE